MIIPCRSFQKPFLRRKSKLMKTSQTPLPNLFHFTWICLLSLLVAHRITSSSLAWIGTPLFLLAGGVLMLLRKVPKQHRIFLLALLCGGVFGCQARLSELLPEEASTIEQHFERIHQQTCHYLKEQLSHFQCSTSETGVIIALTCGDRTHLQPETKKDFQTTGVAHLLALSGLHIGILYKFLQKLLFFLPGRGGRAAKIRGGCTLLLLWLYALVTGLSSSIARAVLMCTCYEISGWQEEPKNGLQALSISALVLICSNPTAPLDLGFQLSYLAMLGIFLIHPILEKLLEKQVDIEACNRWQNRLFQGANHLWKTLSITLSCQFSTLPILLLRFHSIPLAFQLANLLAAPLTAWVIQCLPLVLLLKKLVPTWDGYFVVLQFPLNLLLKIVAIIRQFS